MTSSFNVADDVILAEVHSNSVDQDQGYHDRSPPFLYEAIVDLDKLYNFADCNHCISQCISLFLEILCVIIEIERRKEMVKMLKIA